MKPPFFRVYLLLNRVLATDLQVGNFYKAIEKLFKIPKILIDLYSKIYPVVKIRLKTE